MLVEEIVQPIAQRLGEIVAPGRILLTVSRLFVSNVRRRDQLFQFLERIRLRDTDSRQGATSRQPLFQRQAALIKPLNDPSCRRV
jgi:hypothetical protein